jgi:hypothetical protein
MRAVRGLNRERGQLEDDWMQRMRAEEKSLVKNEGSKKKLGYRMRAVRKGRNRERGQNKEA